MALAFPISIANIFHNLDSPSTASIYIETENPTTATTENKDSMGLFQRKHDSPRENNSRFRDKRGPIGRFISSQSTLSSSESFHRGSSNSLDDREPLIERSHTHTHKSRKPSSNPSRTSLNSSSTSMESSQTRSSSRSSAPKTYTGARYQERLRPGKEISLGALGTYHRNPKGLAAVYDWDAEEGGYIPFAQQKSHRRRWREEIREGQRAEEEERTVRFEGVEEKKAVFRRAFDEHMATKRRV